MTYSTCCWRALFGAIKSCPLPWLQEDPLVGLDFGELNITSQDDDILDEAAGECGTLGPC